MKVTLSSIYSKYDNSLFLRLLYILFLSAPPAISTALKDQAVFGFFKTNLGFMLFLNPDKAGTIIAVALWVPIITTVMHFLGYKAKSDYYYLSQQGTAALMAAIEEVVAKKSERLGKAIKNRAFNKMETHFNPEEQIKTIIDQMYNFLKTINSTQNELAIRLWKVENNTINGLIHHLPHTASARLESKGLLEVESEFKKVISNRKASIIENSNTSKGFSKIDDCKDCNGCNILTIPIIDDKTNMIYSILQVRYKFTNNNSSIYFTKTKGKHLVVFEKFIRRLELEHRIQILYKEKHYV